MCTGSSIACTETLLRSDGKRGRFRVGKRFPWYSCRKLATFFASHRSCICLPKNTLSVLMVSCHLSAPHPSACFPPPRSRWVISALRRARAHMFARTPLATHLPEASPSNMSACTQNLTAFNGYVTLCLGFPNSYVQ